LKKELGIHAEWSIKGKVTFKITAARTEKRTLVIMKMSEVNIAVNSLTSIAYSGCNGGLVIFVEV